MACRTAGYIWCPMFHYAGPQDDPCEVHMAHLPIGLHLGLFEKKKMYFKLLTPKRLFSLDFAAIVQLFHKINKCEAKLN